MTHLMNVPRYTLIVSVFLIFFLFSPMAAGKHIIVIYDVSGSMVRLSTDIYMESKDIRRVNGISDKSLIHRHLTGFAR